MDSENKITAEKTGKKQKMNLPNKITTARMGLVVVLIILLLLPSRWLFNIDNVMIFGSVYLRNFIGAIIFTVASITDYFDGYIARKYNLITNYGKFMDPIADKLLVNSVLIILAVKSSTMPFQAVIPLVFVVLMIARDTIVDGMRLVAVSQNKVLAANIFGKIKTVLQMVALILYLLNGWPFSNQVISSAPPIFAYVLMALATLASLVSGIIYLVQNRNVLKEEV